MPGKAEKMIAVVGARESSTGELADAEQVGRELARRGVVLVCGGMGGVMEAACRGAFLEGGLTVGILPRDSAGSANEYVRIPVVTGMGYARNVIVVQSSRAVIAVGGSYGTLSEIAYALGFGIPVIGLDTWKLEKRNEYDTAIIRADNAEDAVNKALEAAGYTEE